MLRKKETRFLSEKKNLCSSPVTNNLPPVPISLDVERKYTPLNYYFIIVPHTPFMKPVLLIDNIISYISVEMNISLTVLFGICG